MATVKVIAYTQEAKDGILKRDDIMVLSGKMAGICQTPDSMTALDKQEDNAHIKRARGSEKRGHAVLEHGEITLYFEGLSKIQAMVLNSFRQMYTSEKSGRYLDLSSTASTLEQSLYEKWESFFLAAVKETYPKEVENGLASAPIAKEYARYMLSVFNPGTNMAYKTNVHQLSMIYHMISNTIDYIAAHSVKGGFDYRVKDALEGLRNLLKAHDLVFPEVKNSKNRIWDTFGLQVGKRCDDVEVVSDVYMINYPISFVGFAQSHRHRTIKYELYFNDDSPITFYVPMILQTRYPEKVTEWKRDLLSVMSAGEYPNALLVMTREMGHIDDFALKCQERLCGRAQHEICMLTANTVEYFNASREDFTYNGQEILNKLVPVPFDGINTKGEIQGTCLEPCVWGCQKALIREI